MKIAISDDERKNMEKIVTSNVETLNVVISNIVILNVETLNVVTMKMGTLRQLGVQKKKPLRLWDINKIVYSDINIKMNKKQERKKNFTPIRCLMFQKSMLILMLPD